MSEILVVDGEPLICQLLVEVLEGEGFSVVSAANGQQALVKYRLHAKDIELVISDVVMPEMNGPALARRLLAERPDLPIILMSDPADISDLGSQSIVRFLSKPFDLESLVSTVRDLVPEGRSSQLVSRA